MFEVCSTRGTWRWAVFFSHALEEIVISQREEEIVISQREGIQTAACLWF